MWLKFLQDTGQEPYAMRRPISVRYRRYFVTICSILVSGLVLISQVSQPSIASAAGAYNKSTATVSPSALVPGSTTEIVATFTSSIAITVNLDVEVRDASNNQVFQKLFFDQTFRPGQTRRYKVA